MGRQTDRQGCQMRNTYSISVSWGHWARIWHSLVTSSGPSLQSLRLKQTKQNISHDHSMATLPSCPKASYLQMRPIATLSLPLHIFCYPRSRTEKSKPVTNRWLHQLWVHSREPVHQNIMPCYFACCLPKPHHWYLNCLGRLDSIFPCSALSQLSQSKVRNGASNLLLKEGNCRNLPGWQTCRCPWDECSSQSDLYLIIYGLELPLQESKTIPMILAKYMTHYLFSYICL